MDNIEPIVERISIGGTQVEGTVISLSGKSGEFWVNIIPSLNVSGYGKSKDEAFEDLKYNLRVFAEDITSLSGIKRNAELRKLGWKRPFFKQKFAKCFVDDEGVLQNFDSPEEVQRTLIDTANI